MSKFARSFDTSWSYGHDLDEILNWVGDKALEGFELKTLTATTAPSTEYDKKTGQRHDVWRSHYVAVVQKPNA